MKLFNFECDTPDDKYLGGRAAIVAIGDQVGGTADQRPATPTSLQQKGIAVVPNAPAPHAIHAAIEQPLVDGLREGNRAVQSSVCSAFMYCIVSRSLC